MNPFPHRLLLVLPLLLLAAAVRAEDKPPRLFDSDEVLEVTLSAPWQDLVRDERNQDPYPATIEYRDASGATVRHIGTVERRGVKRQEACDFPPIRLRFEKEAVKGSMFRGQKSLKMVTHCERSDRFDQYYRLEMLAYRMYNLVTDFSFRVRPMTVTYLDDKRDDVYDTRFAFVIEDDSDVAERNGMKKLRVPYILPNRFDDTTSSQMSLFQYMIGNVDWSALRGPDPEECCHNVKLAAPRPFTDDDLAYPIAYDFDSSGLVDPPYAAPPDGLGINSVTQRLYRGYCRNDENAMAEVRQQFIGLEPEIMAILEQDTMLNKRSKKKSTRYLERFFDLLKDDRDFERYVTEKCRK
ncbi:MAG: hypothetical protein P8Y54_01675 [Xanthomonadales bacterium]